MNRSTRQVLLVVLVLAIAGAGYWVWQRFFSHGAQIDAMHQACLAEFERGSSRVKSQIDKGAASVPANDPATAIVKDLSRGVRKMAEEFASGVGGATCGTLREACRLDFDGRVCASARARFSDR